MGITSKEIAWMASQLAGPQRRVEQAVQASVEISRQIGGGHVNPFRLAGLRRNTPCPCGSRRKFKACCMRETR